ncbi:MAG: bifunctional 5,10-methylenetetrahydrofolate dehydrogenase/5,10-methenyltetrahydrofolate cyclohydrolase [Nitratireductor sp.]
MGDRRTRLFKGLDLAARMNAESRSLAAGLDTPPVCLVLADRSNAGARAYSDRQAASAAQAGIDMRIADYAGTVAEINAQFDAIAADGDIDAALMLLPLPHGCDPVEAALRLGPEKDVDGLHPHNAGRLAAGLPARPPATAMACLLCAEEVFSTLRGLDVTIVGASRIVGRPLATLLLDAEATVTLCHVATRDLAAHTRQADLVVSAAGVPGLIGAGHLKPGAAVLDVAVTSTPHGLRGDVDPAAVDGHAGVVSHVPDGVGPVTTACLFRNVVEAARAGRRPPAQGSKTAHRHIEGSP